MTVETATYISQLNPSYPASGDPKSEGDDQIRLLKTVLQTQFPNFGTNAITATAAEVNYSVGLTGAIQGQINGKGAIGGQAWTGAHDFTGATSLTAPTPGVGDNSSKVPTTSWVVSLALAGTLPGQAGKAGRFVQTDGASATWQPLFGQIAVISTNTTAVSGRTYVLTAALTLQLPATPGVGDVVYVIDVSGTAAGVIDRNGSNLMGLAQNMTLDDSYVPRAFLYVDATRGWLIAP